MSATVQNSEVKRLFDAGAHFAQAKSRRHPSMKPFILGAKSRTEIIDLAKTDEQLATAKAAMEALAKDAKTVLFVGGKAEIAQAVKAAAMKAGQPYVAARWLGGTISNWVEIKKRIDRLVELSQMSAAGTLAKQHTKLEVVRLGREMKRLEERLDGITELAKRPDALLIVDTKRETHAVKEAQSAGIPVIGIMNSDCNIADAAYPIVANDSSNETVTLILNELADAFIKGRVI